MCIKEGKYDSTTDTLLHIKRVNELLIRCSKELLDRAIVHDDSKLESPEKEYFDEYTPKLKGTTFGSEEYYKNIEGLKVALNHHYENNSHHPQFYEGGVNDMDLFDIVEMFVDWWAASERHEDGDLMKSIDINKERFQMSDQLCAIFKNTFENYKNSPVKCG